MNSKNDYIRDYLGITAWHNAGYTGTRVKALTGERLEGPYVKEHAKQTRLAFLEIAPDAQVTYAPIPTAMNTVEPFLELVGDACVMFVSQSISGSSGAIYADPVIPEDLFLCVGAGNDNESSHNGWMHAENIYGVGAVDIRWSAMRGGQPRPGATLLVHGAQYSSHSDQVDFGCATNLYLPGYIDTFPGTSCAAPTLAGMAALVNDFFIDKTGKPLSHKMMYQFLKDCAVDIDLQGKDDTTGWGLPILPDPSTIDIYKYQTVVENEPEDLKAPYGYCSACGEPLDENGNCTAMQGPICDGWVDEPDYTESEDDGDMTYEKFKEYMDRYMSEAVMDQPSDWAKESCQKAIANGILKGNGKGAYNFKRPITREAYIVLQDRVGMLG